MSIALMTEAWKTDLPAGRKMVLLALCDNANDQGECYPSIKMTAEKCSMGERTVQGHIAALERDGFVLREVRTGRSTIYRVNPRRICTPAESAPPQNLHPTPADFAPPPPQNLHPTPAESAPITINEPSSEPKKKKTKMVKKPSVCLPEWMPTDKWEAFVDFRKQAKAPLTERATTLAIGELDKLRAQGQDPGEVIDQSIMRGWKGLFPVKKQDLPRAGPQRPSAHGGFEQIDYSAGINPDGSF